MANNPPPYRTRLTDGQIAGSQVTISNLSSDIEQQEIDLEMLYPSGILFGHQLASLSIKKGQLKIEQDNYHCEEDNK